MCGDTAAQLQASTFAGCPIKGSDSVQILSCPPYALSIQSLLDVHHLTDVYLKVIPILQGHTAPTVSQSILLKSLDIFGNLRWAKTLQNVALTPNPDQSTSVDLQYTDMEHGQNVKAHMLVMDSVSGVTEVLTQQGRVLFRPDLAVSSVTAPSQANLRQIVNIFASISELKGDLGATANVYLLDGDNVIDVMNGISLAPLGNIGIAFSTVFSTEGIHQLKVAIRDETPGDYDLSNNEKSFSIQVIKPPLEPVFYCASYSHYEQDYQSVVENPYWISTYHVQYTNEYTYQTLYIPVALQSLQKVTLKIAGDGVEQDNLEALNIPLYGFSDGCYSSFSGSQYLGDNVYFYIQTYQDCYGNQSSYAQFNKSAFNQLYFSSFYWKLWGIGYTNSFSSAYGTLLNAVNSVTTRFIVEGDAGAFGGNGNVGFLYNYPFDYAWDYYEYDYSDGLYDEHVTGFSRGKSANGSTCDITTP